MFRKIRTRIGWRARKLVAGRRRDVEAVASLNRPEELPTETDGIRHRQPRPRAGLGAAILTSNLVVDAPANMGTSWPQHDVSLACCPAAAAAHGQMIIRPDSTSGHYDQLT